MNRWIKKMWTHPILIGAKGWVYWHNIVVWMFYHHWMHPRCLYSYNKMKVLNNKFFSVEKKVHRELIIPTFHAPRIAFILHILYPFSYHCKWLRYRFLSLMHLDKSPWKNHRIQAPHQRWTCPISLWH